MKSDLYFKIGMKVYDYLFGWGEVIEIFEEEDYPIKVNFRRGTSESYTSDGCLYEASPQTLSLTEYKLKGYSLQKHPEIGDIVVVKTPNTEYVGFVVETGEFHFFISSKESGSICFHMPVSYNSNYTIL